MTYRYNGFVLIPKINSIIILLLLSLLLISCSNERCIDADDFGFPKITVSARYDESDVTSMSEGNQITPWIDSNYVVTGKPLTMLVRNWEYGVEWNSSQELSAWCPWYGDKDNTNKLPTLCERLIPCQFIDNRMCTTTHDAMIINAPCLMTHGVGLYALISAPDVDPNSSFVSQRNPEGIAIHVGEGVTFQRGTNGVINFSINRVPNYEMFDISKEGKQRVAGGLVYKYDSTTESLKYADSHLYFKILDKFYDDNAGQYRVILKSGVKDTRPDPVEFVTKLVKDSLFGTNKDYGIIQRIYLNIINNSAYRFAVTGMLTLYIMFSALSYLTGNINISNTELITRIIKIAIVSALLKSEYAWNFFNNYLFVYFVGGLDQIIDMIQGAGANGPGSPSILGLLIAPETISKVTALLFMDLRGFIYIILYIIAVYFIVMTVLYASVLYLTSLMAIGMIIVMAPIFICFLLFDITRSLFENWLKQLIGYALQPIILFTGIVFISMIIRSEIYSTLGFRVCNKEFPDLGAIGDILGDISDTLDIGVDLTHSIFFWGFPNPMDSSKFTRARANIPIPMDFYKDDGTLCNAYECIGNRYIELPFLDPDKDQAKIEGFFNGDFLHFDGLLLIFVSLYLLARFNTFSVSISQFLSNTSGSLTSLSGAADSSFAPMQQQINQGLVAPAKFIDDKLHVRKGLGRLKENASTFFAEQYEGIMRHRLAEAALDPKKANASVLAEVKKNMGLDHRDLKVGALNTYDDALKSKLGDKYEQLSSKSFAEVKDALAAEKYKGKKFAELSAQERVDLMKTDKGDLRELQADAQFSTKFQEAYFNAHQDMSARGIGFIGKRSSKFRTLKEIKNRYDAYKARKEEKRIRRGEQIFAGYEGIKRKILSGVVGESGLDRLSEGVTGAAWHDYQYDDPRLRTYSETLKDRQRELKMAEFKEYLRSENQRAGTDVLSYEYQLQMGDVIGSNAKNLMRMKVENDVYEHLSRGEKPALMGDKFMREKATDSQMREMIDTMYAAESQIIQNDPHFAHEQRYEVMNELSADKIKAQHEKLCEYFKRDDIKPDKMSKLILRMHYEQKTDAKDDLQSLSDAQNTFEHSQKVLQKIDEHKKLIHDEIQSHVDKVNKYRVDVGMEKYGDQIKPKEPVVRSVTTIDELVRKPSISDID